MDEFSFPFPPYNIQLDLMREIKQCIEKEQVGIFESPTGTGKSLSVLCATMTWLEEFEKKTEEELLKQSRLTEEVSENEDWILAHKKKLQIMKIKDEAYDKLQILEKVKEKLYQAKAGVVKRDRKRRLRDEGNTEELGPENDAAQENTAPEDYVSDDEAESKPDEPLKAIKVFYASRTHSQLEQLMDELKKTRFSPRVVTAASRQTLCVNEDVRRLKFSHLINERCMELRKGCALEGKRVKLGGEENPTTVKKIASKCPYYKGDAIEELSNEILASAICTTSELGLTEVNLFKIVHYMESTDMCRKFHGFFIRSMKSRVSVSQSSTSKSGIGKLLAAKKLECPEPTPVADDKARSYPSPLFTIKGFLEALSNRCEDGRIIVERKENAAKFRFILLNPASRLMEVVKEARATILIGGTMEPAGLLVECLSRGGVENGIRRFTCSHVIDDHQLLALAIGHQAQNEKFTLTYETRGNVHCMKSVAEALMLLIREIPNGCVAFFTSYDYMAQFMSTLEKFKTGNQCNGQFFLLPSTVDVMWLQMRKAVFVEPRGASGEIWDRFAAAARVGDGAVLFAVAGGKLSEGINFSDELGRAVFMVGLPYPNKNSVELKEKMKYLDSQVPGGGNQLYQSLCMHVINQAIGRAIRHRKDYAMVYLMDSRRKDPICI
ncbi:DNA repair helicase [Teladorsagia circumcincta]|uniref:DNA repair helicase n=2 Tax=Teladorsagia circumcincta TaxID=45464 RepID=A0A2G9UNN7_TELCI|nr:DNA repair helicase [Teladorsagia circumcincta]